MMDISVFRENPDLVKENIRKKYQEWKLPLVDEIIDLDAKNRAVIAEASDLRTQKSRVHMTIGKLYSKLKNASDEEKDALQTEIAEKMAAAKSNDERLAELEKQEEANTNEINKRMRMIPNIIDSSVPLGTDDSCNREVKCLGNPVVPDYEIPFYTEIMERADGIDIDAAVRVSGYGSYYLAGETALLYSAIMEDVRNHLIKSGFVYTITPTVFKKEYLDTLLTPEQIQSQKEPDETLILRYMDQIRTEDEFPKQQFCFHHRRIKDIAYHGVLQAEQLEVTVLCLPEDDRDWMMNLGELSLQIAGRLGIPARLVECCSSTLDDRMTKSYVLEAWSPRVRKYYQIGKCSNFGDELTRRLHIRVKGENGIVVPRSASSTMLFSERHLMRAFLENNLQKDGTLRYPQTLRKYIEDAISPF